MGVEEIYGLVRIAVVSKRPISAVYHERKRMLCPHRLGKNKEGKLQVLCYQFSGQSERGLDLDALANWRCMAVEKLSEVKLLDGRWHSAPNHSRPQTCVAEVDVDAEDEAQ